MTPPDPARAIPLEDLLANAGWVRGLAARLVGDSSAAEDVAQDTLLAALGERRRPGHGGSLREWLGAVARNLARERRRKDARRVERETRAARAEAAEPSAADVVARAATHRTLVEAVMELDEPYRTAVLLRYFENLPPREVAKRTAVPVETVRTRLKRALEHLRARMDRSHGGDRRTWLAALVPLADGRGWLGASALPIVAMNAKLVTLCSCVALAGVAAWFAFRPATSASSGPPGSPVSAAAPGLRALGDSLEPESPAEVVDPADTRRAATPIAGAAELSAPAVSGAVLRGRLLDDHGSALAGILVTLRSTGAEEYAIARAQSGSDGSFEMDSGGKSGDLFVDSEDWVTLMSATWRGRAPQHPPVVVAAPVLRLTGRVVDAGGSPLAGARVELRMPEGLRAGIDAVLDDSRVSAWTGETDEDGEFALKNCPSVAGAKLHVALDGLLPHSEELPPLAALDLVVTLSAPGEAGAWLRGRVVDADGKPVRAAQVAWGIDLTRTGKDGSFAFPRDDPQSLRARYRMPARKLVALAPGYVPAELELPDGADLDQFFVLRLGGAALSIEGRAHDWQGNARAGLVVWLADSETFGVDERGPMQVESLLAGSDDHPWTSVKTKSGGRFVLEGLQPRDYRIALMDPDTLLRIESDPIAAGTAGVVLRLPEGQLIPRVAGRVVSYWGAPVAGASIHPMCDSFRARWDGQIVSTSHSGVDGTRTDEEGRFELRNVPKSLVYLRIDGEGILPLEYGRFVEGDPRFVAVKDKSLPVDRIEDLEIQVGVRCHLTIELADPSAADEVAVLDAQGQPVEISLMHAGGRRDGPRLPISGGRSGAMAVPDFGVAVVLYLQGAEVLRQGIELVPGQPLHLKL